MINGNLIKKEFAKLFLSHIRKSVLNMDISFNKLDKLTFLFLHHKNKILTISLLEQIINRNFIDKKTRESKG